MGTGEALALMIAMARELTALSLAYQQATQEGRSQLSDEEVQTFSVRAEGAGDKLQLKIDSL